jgi:hypothetical protein
VVPCSTAGARFKQRGRYTAEKGRGAREGNEGGVGGEERKCRVLRVRLVGRGECAPGRWCAEAETCRRYDAMN